MPYYTEEQRRRGQETRRRNLEKERWLEGRIETADYTRSNLSRLGIKVDKVRKPVKKPMLSDYGLPAGIDAEIKRLDEEAAESRRMEAERLRQDRRQNFLLVMIFIVSPLVMFVFINMLSSMSWLDAAVSIIMPGLPVWIALFGWGFSDPSPPEIKLTGMRQTYENYRSELKDWQYWERKRVASYWSKMNGAKFEHEMASLFRLAGFQAEVTKASGDGGIDIILTRDQRRVAVQCKRYQKDVGPHVIRDLWGTMHHQGYEEGCIVTTAYFTQGVKDFARGKNIYLINMRDILDTLGGDGIGILKKKMHVED